MTEIAMPESKSIHLYYPYWAIFPFDPKKILTIGDQIIAEHVFAVHSREDIKSGFAPALSDVQFDYQANLMTIKPKYELKNSAGRVISIDQMCRGLESSFKGTQHSAFRSIVKSVECLGDRIEVYFTKIPNNIKQLLTVPDFSIFELANLPVQSNVEQVSTGPYFIVERPDKNLIKLKRNQHYPAELVANTVDDVYYHTYPPGTVDEFIQQCVPVTHHLVYFSGTIFPKGGEKILKDKGYRVQIFPSEYLTFLAFRPGVSESDRKVIGNALDLGRNLMALQQPLSNHAFSIAPADRPFGISKAEYETLFPFTEPNAGHQPTKLSRTFSLGIYHTSVNHPYLKAIVELLTKQFPDLEVKVIQNYSEYNSSTDFQVNVIGISPSDPLPHLFYLIHNFPNLAAAVTDEQITAVSLIHDAEKFNQASKALEMKLVKERLLIPIAHFPGIVAEAPGFERDQNLAWSWGTQAWTYRINSPK